MIAPLPMKRTLLAILLGLVAVTGLVVGYRAYKQAADRALAEQRAAVQLAQIKEHEAELARRTAAIREARRMAEARALEEVARQERQREEEQAAQAALAAAQAELARLAAESDRLLAERTLTTADAGRFNVTHRDADQHFFKVPTLRQVAETGPWFHDGHATTLEDAVRTMGAVQLGRDLEAPQVQRIAAFLRALTGPIPAYATLPPST